jgi:NAD dependent epimerase/dehydratase family enzyme
MICVLSILKRLKSRDGGAFNAAITDDTTNASFSATFAKVYGYKIWLPNVPAFLIKLALGESGKTTIDW